MEWSDVKQSLGILETRDILRLPDPVWIIDGLLPAGTSVLYGPPGEGKSFVALSWAAAIVQGIPWHGHEVQQGPVLYIAGEGGSGLKKRQQAIMADKGLKDLPGFYVRLEPFIVHDEDQIEAFVQGLETFEIFPRLIIVDTLATTFGADYDESKAGDMQMFLNHLKHISNETGTSCLVIHHTGKDASRGARGASSLKGGIEAEFKCSAEKNELRQIVRINLTNEKQKDWEQAEPIVLVPRASADSLVLDLQEGDGEPSISTSGALQGPAKQIYETFLKYQTNETLSSMDLQIACQEEFNLSRASFYRHRKQLVDQDYLMFDKGILYLKEPK